MEEVGLPVLEEGRLLFECGKSEGSGCLGSNICMHYCFYCMEDVLSRDESRVS